MQITNAPDCLQDDVLGRLEARPERLRCKQTSAWVRRKQDEATQRALEGRIWRGFAAGGAAPSRGVRGANGAAILAPRPSPCLITSDPSVILSHDVQHLPSSSVAPCCLVSFFIPSSTFCSLTLLLSSPSALFFSSILRRQLSQDVSSTLRHITALFPFTKALAASAPLQAWSLVPLLCCNFSSAHRPAGLSTPRLPLQSFVVMYVVAAFVAVTAFLSSQLSTPCPSAANSSTADGPVDFTPSIVRLLPLAKRPHHLRRA